MRLGELLKMNGLISEHALAETLEAQGSTQPHRKLGQLLTEQGLITARQLLEALEFQLGGPCIDLNESRADVAARFQVACTEKENRILVELTGPGDSKQRSRSRSKASASFPAGWNKAWARLGNGPPHALGVTTLNGTRFRYYDDMMCLCEITELSSVMANRYVHRVSLIASNGIR